MAQPPSNFVAAIQVCDGALEASQAFENDAPGLIDKSREAIVAYDKTIVGSVGSSATEFNAAIDLLPLLPMKSMLGNVLPLEHYAEVWTNFRQRNSLKVLLQVHKDVDLG